MRVLFAIAQFRPDRGGSEVQAERLATALLDLGIQVEVVTRRPRGLPAHEEIDGVMVHRVWGPGIGRFKSLGQAAAMLHWMKRTAERFDVFHAHQAMYPAYAAVSIARRVRRPSVVKVGNVGQRFDLRLLERAVPLGMGRRMSVTVTAETTRFVAVSTRMHEELVEWGIERSRIAVIPNGVPCVEPVNHDRRREARKRLRLPADAEVVVCVASLSSKKDHPTLLRAFRLLAHRRRKLRLLLVGDGDERNRLEQQAMELDLNGKITFEGWRSDIRDPLHAADVFVLPSRVEGLSNALLEAMAVGLPVVVSDAAGNVEAVREGRVGSVFPVGEADSLADCLAELLSDRDRAARLGEAARRNAIENYSMTSVAKRYLELYESLEGKRAPGG